MNVSQRMSPLTAFFLGLFGLGSVLVAVAGAIVLYGIRIVDTRSEGIQDLAKTVMADMPEVVNGVLVGLPEFVSELPPAAADIFSHERVPSYVKNLDVSVQFVPHSRHEGLRPVVRVVNNGQEVVAWLSVNVVAVDKNGLPIRGWSDVVATSFTLPDCNELRGPLFPGQQRYAFLKGVVNDKPLDVDGLTAKIEITDVRLWQQEKSTTTLTADAQ